jgi:uncharacterized OB-fold protein
METMTENPTRVVAEYCSSCGEVHYPVKIGAGELCTTCRYWQTHDRRQVSDSPSPSEEGRS